MNEYLQSAAVRVTLKAFLSSDHVSPATGQTIAIVISKNGAAFGNPSAGATNATEIAHGWYYVDLSTTDTATLGPLIVRGTCSGVDDAEKDGKVILAKAAVTLAAGDVSGNLPTDAYARVGAPAGASIAADVAAVKSSVGTPMQTGTVTLATAQPNYAPSKAGDAMTLTGAYDAAKTAVAAGALMGLADGAITDAKFTIPTLTGPAVGPVGFIAQVWRRLFKKVINDKVGHTLKTYADDGTTVVTTQTTSDVANVQTQGPAS